MKIKQISGTGNGVCQESRKDFSLAFSEYSKLISKISKFLENEKSEWFSGGSYHVINNWKRMYKIDVPSSEFPFKMANTLSMNCWGRLQVSVLIPLKFKAPQFNGGDGENNEVALVTEVDISNVNKFAKDERFSMEMRRTGLEEYLKFCRSERDEKYKQKIASCEYKLKRMKDYIAEAQKQIADNFTSIPEVEKKIRETKRAQNKII